MWDQLKNIIHWLELLVTKNKTVIILSMTPRARLLLQNVGSRIPYQKQNSLTDHWGQIRCPGKPWYRDGGGIHLPNNRKEVVNLWSWKLMRWFFCGWPSRRRLLLPGTWSYLWFSGVRECPPWCSIVGATVTVHQSFCILHSWPGISKRRQITSQPTIVKAGK